MRAVLAPCCGIVALCLGSCSDRPATDPNARKPVWEYDNSRTCKFGKNLALRKPEPCDVYADRANDYMRRYVHFYQWRGKSGQVATFAGMQYPGVWWWFGTLNGKPAAGYSPSRDQHVFATEDGSFEFETWVEGWD